MSSGLYIRMHSGGYIFQSSSYKPPSSQIHWAIFVIFNLWYNSYMRTCAKIAFPSEEAAQASLTKQLAEGILQSKDVYHVYRCYIPGCLGIHIGHDERYTVIGYGDEQFAVTDRASGYVYPPVDDRERAFNQARVLNRADREIRRNTRRGAR